MPNTPTEGREEVYFPIDVGTRVEVLICIDNELGHFQNWLDAKIAGPPYREDGEIWYPVEFPMQVVAGPVLFDSCDMPRQFIRMHGPRVRVNWCTQEQLELMQIAQRSATVN